MNPVESACSADKFYVEAGDQLWEQGAMKRVSLHSTIFGYQCVPVSHHRTNYVHLLVTHITKECSRLLPTFQSINTKSGLNLPFNIVPCSIYHNGASDNPNAV